MKQNHIIVQEQFFISNTGKNKRSYIKMDEVFEKAKNHFEKDLPELVSKYREQGW